MNKKATNLPINQLIQQSASQSAYQFTNNLPMNHQATNLPINQLIQQSTSQPIWHWVNQPKGLPGNIFTTQPNSQLTNQQIYIIHQTKQTVSQLTKLQTKHLTKTSISQKW